ncbi:nucleotidyltransferase domain-containing protein [Candidatus Saganbacteria bacterium]|nr:nucleotidyltransferase domain-containing protein [Candidatus Saganbacteria bacterium]
MGQYQNRLFFLKDLKTDLQELYHQRFKGMFLFGSYAHGNEKPESDVDIGVIIDDYSDVCGEIDAMGGIASSLSLENNIVISLHPFREKDWINKKTPLILNLKKEGIAI